MSEVTNVMITLIVMIQIIQIVSGVAQGGPGRAHALPSACSVLPLRFQKDRDTLIEQSNILLKRSMCHANLPRLAKPLQIVKVRTVK